MRRVKDFMERQMNMKKMVIAMVVAAAASGARAEELPTYSLGLPRPAAFRNAVEASSNEWLSANAVFAATGGYECYTNGSESANEIVGATERYRLKSSEVGYSWERSKPEYYLADVITPPENVDWKLTADLYAEMAAADPDSVAGFLLNPDPDNLCVYATDGGTHPFTWVLKDGTRLTLVYTIGSVCQGRPKRIYWTDAPYNAPSVSLAGKFVKFFGNEAVLDLQLGTVTNVIGGTQVEERDKVLSGLYFDSQSSTLVVDGVEIGSVPFATSFAWASVRDNFIGVAREGQTAFKGTEIAEVTIFRDALSVEEIKAEAYRIRTGAEAAVTGYYSFRQGGYLTIDRRIDGETVLLRIPNHEVSTSLYRSAGWCTSASTTIPPRGRSAR